MESKMQSLAVLVLSVLVGSVVSFDELPGYLKKPAADGQLWSVLVAGSSTWGNYRHQADICHAYQVLKNHGIPDERIIVMMVDDLANDPQNPTPGVIINHPKGKDVYKGVPKDYTGLKGVTPENFMAVLRGDKQALEGKGSGKVLESGPNDHVFVYFADHGAPGIIAFPETELSATDLMNTINFMNENKKYGKMVIYIEACESGSMFQNLLPKNINVFATTAANGEESSYACYYDETRDTYLGDLYSVNWLEDSDKENLSQETLVQQYKIVKKETTESHVQEFGDLKIGKLPVGEFQGRKDSQSIVYPEVEKDTVRSRDVHIEIAKRKFMRSNSDDEKAEMLKTLSKMYRNRMFLTQKVEQLVSDIAQDEKLAIDILKHRYELRDYECYDEVRKYFNKECFNIFKNEYALDSLYALVNLCEKKIPVEKIKRSMLKVCDHPPVYGIV